MQETRESEKVARQDVISGLLVFRKAQTPLAAVATARGFTREQSGAAMPLCPDRHTAMAEGNIYASY
jgi:hypothetical protein